MGVYVIGHANNYQPAADGQYEWILETLPMRGILVSLRGSVTAANTVPNIQNLCDMITDISLLLGGTTIWQSNTRDIVCLMPQICGRTPYYRGSNTADNDLIMLSFYIPMGRDWGSGKWLLPATPAGQLRLRLTADIAVTGIDTLSIDIDGVYDDGAASDGHMRVTTLAAVAAAVGDLNIDLPVGRWMAGIGIYPTTWRTTQAGANGVNSLKILRDGVEIRYPFLTVQNARLLTQMTGSDLGNINQHVHMSDIAAAYTQFQATAAPGGAIATVGNNLFMDFDPARDGTGLLDLRTCNRLQVRLNMGTAEAVRIHAIEWWPSTGQGQPALGTGM